MSQSENERPAKTRPDAKAAPRDRQLSEAELETVAAAGDGGKGDPNQKNPPPPANST
jgi:hypothetical protein